MEQFNEVRSSDGPLLVYHLEPDGHGGADEVGEPVSQAELNTGAVIQVRPDADPRVLALYKEGVRLREYAATRIVASDDDVKTATDDLSVIAGLK